MNARELAKTLVKLSAAQNGTIEAERVKAVCEYVEASVAKGSRLRVLEEYRKAIKPLLQRQSASVETSGELSEETFEKLAARIRAKALRFRGRWTKVCSAESACGWATTFTKARYAPTSKGSRKTVKQNNRRENERDFKGN